MFENKYNDIREVILYAPKSVKELYLNAAPDDYNLVLGDVRKEKIRKMFEE